MTRMTPSTLVSHMARQLSSSASAIDSIPKAPPALFTRTPHSGTALASAVTASGSVTSQATERPPISSARASIRSARRAAQITSKPSAASRRAVAAPMPLLAPVTTATVCAMAASLPYPGMAGAPGALPPAVGSVSREGA